MMVPDPEKPSFSSWRDRVSADGGNGIPASTDDDLLAMKMVAGDDEAFRVLFERYVPVLSRRLRSRLPAALARKVSVSDLLQEIRLVVHQRRAEFDSPGNGAFRNWILTIADYKLKETIRRHLEVAKRAVEREVTRGKRPETGQFLARGPSPSQVAIGAELKALAREAMASLPGPYQEVLGLVRREQLNFREAAERLGKSYEATKKLYGRALVRLKQEFESRGGTTSSPKHGGDADGQR
jgi:RNA polymerase sigma-70 factor (subfamily 1)